MEKQNMSVRHSHMSEARTAGVIEAMATLRRRCPWSSRQDHGSLEKYAREETEELIEALDDYRGDPSPHHRSAVVDELGDVFYQVLFHSALLDESGSVPYGHTLGMIVDGLEAKLVRRHPLAFGEGAADGQMASLEDVEREYRRIKTDEKQQAAEEQQKDTNQ
ncbi:MazG nucleotide pyrophosphohydrolase domain-containing protein [Brevibacterium sandarakinum]|uniref:MazG nucleotide pyrophosphohydrolase domain-containing protein n=1 Tax=Brevibacterium sandarakinum TaxID=629680 RepID=A0A1H1M1G4_BRESA|nr:MazG nucleotide pyrophosphohydrolase domain-containing protein [Brevibacterium sandarakinum]